MLCSMTMPRIGVPLPEVFEQSLDAVCWEALSDGLRCFTVAFLGGPVLHGSHNGRHQLAWVPQIQCHPSSFAELLILHCNPQPQGRP